MESKNNREGMSWEKFKFIENRVKNEFIFRQKKFYRFKRIFAWSKEYANKQQLIRVLKNLEDNNEIIIKQVSGHKLYKRNNLLFN